MNITLTRSTGILPVLEARQRNPRFLNSNRPHGQDARATNNFMRIIRSIGGILQTLSESEAGPRDSARILTGLSAIDALLPGGGLTPRAMHEILSPTDMPSLFLPLLFARSAAKTGWIVWCDFEKRFYPPAAAALGLPLEKLVLLRPTSEREQLWAATECLRSAGVAACVMSAARLSFIQARRMQLAAERGGGIGLLLRPAKAMSQPYAAATRWLVRPEPGERTLQRWSAQLIHGHGGRVGKSVLLEVCHETHHVRALAAMGHRTNRAQAAAASA